MISHKGTKAQRQKHWCFNNERRVLVNRGLAQTPVQVRSRPWLRLVSYSVSFLCLCLLQSSFSSAEESLTNSLGMKLNRLPAGKFQMGSPPSEAKRRTDENQREVIIEHAFFMATTEVTQKQWTQLMETKPWSKGIYVGKRDDCAATFVSWEDANEFCRKLSFKEDRTYRLPTEAEWEFACRAGTETAFSFGGTDTSMKDFGWYGANTFDIGNRYAHPVAQKKPNAFGLFDMHGNNWEWCADKYREVTGEKRVIRGGSWHGLASLCRSASRFKRNPDIRLNDLGFRVVLEIPKRD